MFIIYYHGLWTCSMASFLLSPCLNHQLCVRVNKQNRTQWKRERKNIEKGTYIYTLNKKQKQKKNKRSSYCHSCRYVHITNNVPLCAAVCSLCVRFDWAFSLTLVIFFCCWLLWCFCRTYIFLFLFSFSLACFCFSVYIYIFWLRSYKDVKRNDMSTISMRILNKLQFCFCLISCICILFYFASHLILFALLTDWLNVCLIIRVSFHCNRAVNERQIEWRDVQSHIQLVDSQEEEKNTRSNAGSSTNIVNQSISFRVLTHVSHFLTESSRGRREKRQF